MWRAYELTTVSSWRYSSVSATHETRSLHSRTKLYTRTKEKHTLMRDRAIGMDILELKAKQGFGEVGEGREGPVIYAAVRCPGKPV